MVVNNEKLREPIAVEVGVFAKNMCVSTLEPETPLVSRVGGDYGGGLSPRNCTVVWRGTCEQLIIRTQRVHEVAGGNVCA